MTRNKTVGPAVSVEPVSAALNERLAAARAYQAAQKGLMTLIVEESDEATVCHQIGVLRVARAMFHNTEPFREGEEPMADAASIQATLQFVELLADTRANDQLILEWLATAERPALTDIERYVDRALEISADPRYDIYVVAGDMASDIIAALQQRNCARILDWAAIRADAVEGEHSIEAELIVEAEEAIDVRKAERALAAIPEITVCRPQRVWCLWGPEAHCPMSIREALDARLRQLMINRNAIGALGASWAKQFIRNLPSLVRQGRNTSALFDSMPGSGAIVIGAGPSLDEQIEWIKAQTPKPVIICAYKALKSLAKNGITPDFVVMLDPNQQLRHLEGVDLQQIAGFVVEVSVWPEVLAKIDRPILPYFAGDGTRILSEVFGRVRLPIIPTGGSVFHTGMQLAKILGCTEVTIVGADFGFPDDRLYADGAGTGDTLKVAADKRSYLRQPLDQRARAGMLIQSTANDGSVIATSLELESYRLWTEYFVREWQQRSPVKVYNLAPKGARIEGAEFVDAASHRAAPATRAAMDVTAATPHLVKPNSVNGALKSRLKRKIGRLRALGKACHRAITAARKRPATDLSIYGGVVKRAASCPEVSLLLNKQLAALDEQAKRTTVDVPQRLRGLIEQAEQQAVETAELYLGAERQLTQLSTVRS
jgi:hypothetical protein